jgi:hypothetical protein
MSGRAAILEGGFRRQAVGHFLGARCRSPTRNGRRKSSITLPPDVKLTDAPAGKTISQLLARRRDRRFIAPRAPDLEPAPASEYRLAVSPDPTAAAKDYYKRSGIFPIMHLVGVRRELVQRHPWLPATVLKAFEQAKDEGAGTTQRYLRHEGHAAFRGGESEGSARI